MSNFETVSKGEVGKIIKGPESGLLYKYCRVETAVKIFQSSGVLLDSVSNFNDPFEGCAIPKWPSDDVLREHIKSHYPESKWREVYASARRRKEQFPNRFPPDAEEEFRKIGISCFSEVSDNLLMWGHYAEKHQGACIGFRYRGIVDNLVFRYLKTKVSCVPTKVMYSDDFPIWQIASGNYGLHTHNTKASCWAYEQEWRISSLGTAGIILPIPHKAFSHVIFGAKSSEEGQEKILNAILARGYDGTGLTLKKARLSQREYKLEFDDWRPPESL